MNLHCCENIRSLACASHSKVTLNTVQHKRECDVKFQIHDLYYRIFDKKWTKIWIFSHITELFTTFLNALLLVFVRHMVQQIRSTDSFLRSLHLLTWSRNSMLCMECSFSWSQNISRYTTACYYCIQGIIFQDLRSPLQCC